MKSARRSPVALCGRGGAPAACAAHAAALALHACALPTRPSAPVPPPRVLPASGFLGTVDRITYSPLVDSDLNWLVSMKVERVISGPDPGPAFSFRVRNPTRDGIEVGRTFRTRAVPSGRGYRIERLERVVNPGAAPGPQGRSAR